MNLLSDLFSISLVNLQNLYIDYIGLLEKYRETLVRMILWKKGIE